jgi:hypothetical protein
MVLTATCRVCCVSSGLSHHIPCYQSLDGYLAHSVSVPLPACLSLLSVVLSTHDRQEILAVQPIAHHILVSDSFRKPTYTCLVLLVGSSSASATCSFQLGVKHEVAARGPFFFLLLAAGTACVSVVVSPACPCGQWLDGGGLLYAHLQLRRLADGHRQLRPPDGGEEPQPLRRAAVREDVLWPPHRPRQRRPPRHRLHR